MKLMTIAMHLQDSNRGTFGSDIFVTEMPLDCKEGLLLMDTYSGSRIDHELPGWRDTGFRLVTRSADYLTGEDLARSTGEFLKTQQEVTIRDILVKKCLPVTDPHPYRRSEAGYWEFEVDVEITYLEL